VPSQRIGDSHCGSALSPLAGDDQLLWRPKRGRLPGWVGAHIDAIPRRVKASPTHIGHPSAIQYLRLDVQTRSRNYAGAIAGRAWPAWESSGPRWTCWGFGID
jgi:hypothetical protein